MWCRLENVSKSSALSFLLGHFNFEDIAQCVEGIEGKTYLSGVVNSERTSESFLYEVSLLRRPLAQLTLPALGPFNIAPSRVTEADDGNARVRICQKCFRIHRHKVRAPAYP